MNTITYLFTPLDRPLNGRYIYAKGLHGLLFNITRQADKEESDWLHALRGQKPFSLVPLYDGEGCLAGIRLSAIIDRVATLFQRTGDWFAKMEYPCQLGGHEFIISDCRITAGPNWQQLALSEPSRQIGLNFISPTSFKQGDIRTPLPLPATVFGSPYRLWKAFAPPMMVLSSEWLEWCTRNVFITQHRIETVAVTVNQKETFTGFVGEVWFEAHRGSELQQRTWQALSSLAAFCGVGHMTTMGMGAVEQLS